MWDYAFIVVGREYVTQLFAPVLPRITHGFLTRTPPLGRVSYDTRKLTNMTYLVEVGNPAPTKLFTAVAFRENAKKKKQR